MILHPTVLQKKKAASASGHLDRAEKVTSLCAIPSYYDIENVPLNKRVGSKGLPPTLIEAIHNLPVKRVYLALHGPVEGSPTAVPEPQAKFYYKPPTLPKDHKYSTLGLSSILTQPVQIQPKRKSKAVTFDVGGITSTSAVVACV